MNRALNVIFALLLAAVLLFGEASMHSAIYIGIIAAFIFCSWAFLFGWLSRPAALAAMVMGSVTFALGSWPVVIALLAFFLSSALISRNHHAGDKQPVRRDELQVWANGFWMALWVAAAFFTENTFFMMAALAALATATADTWATELGSQRFEVKTYHPLSQQVVPAGEQGGVSWAGLLASLIGSGVIAAVYLIFSGRWLSFLLIMISGFAGAFFDSLLGISIQGKEFHFNLISLKKFKIQVDNNLVNCIATGLGSLLILLLNGIIQ